MNKVILNPQVTIGGQPSPADLEQLKKEGFRSVVNLRTAEEPSALAPEAEANAVRSLGMAYAHIPVTSQNLSSAQADQVSESISRLPKPVFVHCQGGTRAGALALMHLGKEAGWNADQAFDEGEKAGYQCESNALKQFARTYLDRGDSAQDVS